VSQAQPGAQAAPAAVPAAPPREVTLLDLASVALRYRRSLVLLPLLFMAVGVFFSLRTPRTYRADGAFVLQDAGGGGARSRVSGLAAQFGVTVPSAGTDVPQLYADLLLSRRFMTQLAETRYSFTSGGKRYSGTPTQLFGIDAGSPQATRRETLKLLGGMVNAEVNPMTGVVGFGVSTPWPALSEQIGKQLLAMVAQFNVSTRQSQAAAERRFTEGRLNQAARELRAAENALQGFLESNRRIDNAPELVLRRERLQRDIAEHQTVYAMLSQAYEQARIDEVRDTPVITVIETPAGSARPEPRGTVTRGLLLLLLGLMLAVGIAFWREMLRMARERQAPELNEFLRLRDESLGPLARRRRGAAADGHAG
jgi:uncharacterized protein involved in exopolysaccharide biosynthesis